MKVSVTIYSAILAFAGLTVSNAALSIKTLNVVGFDSTTSAIVDNTGNVIPQDTGIVAIGTFGDLTDVEIQALSNGSSIESSFAAVGFTDMNLGDGLWEDIINNPNDTSAFVGQSIFTVVGNGSTLASSDQFLIYRHSSVNGTGDFNQDPNTNGDAFVAEGGASTGSLVVGGHGTFEHDFGAGDVAAFNLVPVPEPSSTALLGLGGLALILRRRR